MRALLAAALAAAVLAPAAAARVAEAPGLVFVGAKRKAAPGKVLAVRADGTRLRTLPLGERDAAWWSPDGSRVVVSRGRLTIMRADGTHPVPLRVNCRGSCDVAWSPRGTRIAYTVVDSCPQAPCEARLVVVDADGTGRRVLLRFDGATVTSPSWSPDGRLIAFVEEASGVQDLNMVRASGRGFTRLAPADGGRFFPRYRPVWTPDGKRILFSARRGGVSRVLSVARTGGDLQTLANGFWPTLSANGKRVAFVVSGNRGFVAPLAGGTAQRVARMVASPLAWSPDGRRLAYLSTGGRVRVASAAGRGSRDVTGRYARLGSLAWR